MGLGHNVKTCTRCTLTLHTSNLAEDFLENLWFVSVGVKSLQIVLIGQYQPLNLLHLPTNLTVTEGLKSQSKKG